MLPTPAGAYCEPFLAAARWAIAAKESAGTLPPFAFAVVLMMRAAASIVIGVGAALPAFEDLLMEFTFIDGLPNWQRHPR